MKKNERKHLFKKLSVFIMMFLIAGIIMMMLMSETGFASMTEKNLVYPVDGILMVSKAEQSNGFVVELDYIDPDSGIVTHWKSFPFYSQGGDVTGTSFRCENNTSSMLQYFSDDMTRMASTVQKSTGERHIGWIDENGFFTDVSEKITVKNDFSGITLHGDPCFWKDYLYFVDFATGERQVKRVPIDNLVPDAVEMVLDNEFWDLYLRVMPDGRVFDDFSALHEYYNESMSYAGNSNMFTDWISRSEYVGTDANTILGSQYSPVYKYTITSPDGSNYEKTPLTPEIAYRLNRNAAVSPDRTRVAFLSRLSNGPDTSEHLFIVPIEGGDPVKVETDYPFTSDFSYSNTYDASILIWTGDIGANVRIPLDGSVSEDASEWMKETGKKEVLNTYTDVDNADLYTNDIFTRSDRQVDKDYYYVLFEFENQEGISEYVYVSYLNAYRVNEGEFGAESIEVSDRFTNLETLLNYIGLDAGTIAEYLPEDQQNGTMEEDGQYYSFQYAYDIQTFSQYPHKGDETGFSGIKAPLISYRTFGESCVGDWTLRPLGNYDQNLKYEEGWSDKYTVKELVETVAHAYGRIVNELVIYELKKNGEHICYGVIKAEGDDGGVLFAGTTWSGGAGYYLSNEDYTDSSSMTRIIVSDLSMLDSAAYSPVTSVDQIPEKTLDQLISAGEDAFIRYTSGWTSGYELKAVDYCGNYLVLPKEDNGEDYNCLYLIYKIDFIEIDGNEYVFYFPVRFRNIFTDEDQNCFADPEDYRISDHTYNYGPDDQYSVDGYGSTEDFYNTVVQPMTGSFTVENNMISSPANLDQAKGTVVPNDEELLNTDQSYNTSDDLWMTSDNTASESLSQEEMRDQGMANWMDIMTEAWDNYNQGQQTETNAAETDDIW